MRPPGFVPVACYYPTAVVLWVTSWSEIRHLVLDGGQKEGRYPRMECTDFQFVIAEDGHSGRCAPSSDGLEKQEDQ